MPLDRLLVETDAPYLAPVPHRGRRNEPAFVVETARVVAEAKGVALEALAAATRANTLRLFAKMPPAGRALEPALTILGCGSSAGVPRVGAGLGRLRSIEPEEPPPPLLGAGRARRAPAA